MNDNGHLLDRRRLLAGAAAASAVTVTGLAVATTTGAAAAPGRPATPLVSRDRIATAALRAPDGSALPVAVQADFHARLAAWLAFWSANSPAAWSVPVQVVARIEAAGDALVLHGIRHRRDDELRAGFAAGRRDATHLATSASLHHHFPSVRVRPDGTIRVADGPAGFTGAPEQVAFAVAACRELWGDNTATADRWAEHAARVLARAGHRTDAASHAGWAAFTRTSLRRGLGTESYE
ncbi:hypothetical protein IRY44_06140 [Micromonospora sp. ANENR4]|uniref:hypothetical protein n=1 Tax=unclassified Micromonospora TaxID=2617518 RepID=UPI00188E6E2E|nr:MULTISPECIES: hypothetical protein [unclassified Micromonospora]MBF5029319.1 hypothetical protein [Micromonospora sp. ANENR4]MCZ7473474.1 hypothetical protein [Micromonospora sp. WMMC273]